MPYFNKYLVLCQKIVQDEYIGNTFENSRGV